MNTVRLHNDKATPSFGCKAQASAIGQGGTPAVRVGPLNWTLPTNRPELGDLQGKVLRLHLTFPAPPAHNRGSPVVVLYSGFLAAAAWYEATAQRLAAAGYVVVQYDPPQTKDRNTQWGVLTLPMTWFPAQEVPVFGALLEKLEGDGGDLKIPKGITLNTKQLFLAGHSRGGDLAALIFSDKSYGGLTQAAYLLDPVGSSTDAQTLCDSKRAVGVLPADLTGFFNPPWFNYRAFINKASGTQVDRSSPDLGFKLTHMLFCDGGPKLNEWMNRVDVLSWPVRERLALGRTGMQTTAMLEERGLMELAEKKGLDAVVAEVALQVLGDMAKPKLRNSPGTSALLGTADGARYSGPILAAETPPALGVFSEEEQQQLGQLASALAAQLAAEPTEWLPFADGLTGQVLGTAAEADGQRTSFAAAAMEDMRRVETAQLSSANMVDWFEKERTQS